MRPVLASGMLEVELAELAVAALAAQERVAGRCEHLRRTMTWWRLILSASRRATARRDGTWLMRAEGKGRAVTGCNVCNITGLG